MFDFETKYSKYKNCYLEVNKYMADGNLCIDIYI